ncbi:hypothetical protein TNCV_3542191 [Trichonephila clavipes]|uniref:Uncharacterized protein n=1 Tax=Trichonephila clavipes TaxID=2585209 RepID=A0A8X6VC87_TRICX|nr:hypothetical protein TNCV_3542191 [Trichonephila clavipes]
MLKLNLDSSLKMTCSISLQSNLVVHDTTPNGGVGSECHWQHYTICPSARRLAMFREDTGVRSKGAAVVWTAANDAVGYLTRACRMM